MKKIVLVLILPIVIACSGGFSSLNNDISSFGTDKNVTEKSVKAIENPTEKQIGKYELKTKTLAATVITGTYKARDLPVGTVIKEPTTGEEFVLIANGDIAGTANLPATWLSLSPPYAYPSVESDDPNAPALNTVAQVNNMMSSRYSGYTDIFKQKFNTYQFINIDNAISFCTIGSHKEWSDIDDDYIDMRTIDNNRYVQFIGDAKKISTGIYDITKGYLYEHLLNNRMAVGWEDNGGEDRYGARYKQFSLNCENDNVEFGLFGSGYAPLAYAVTCPLDTLITLYNGTFHTHSYILKSDATHHWQECICSSIINAAAHYDITLQHRYY